MIVIASTNSPNACPKTVTDLPKKGSAEDTVFGIKQTTEIKTNFELVASIRHSNGDIPVTLAERVMEVM